MLTELITVRISENKFILSRKIFGIENEVSSLRMDEKVPESYLNNFKLKPIKKIFMELVTFSVKSIKSIN
jgi:hypothetical protein